jgi:hypothetical protein
MNERKSDEIPSELLCELFATANKSVPSEEPPQQSAPSCSHKWHRVSVSQGFSPDCYASVCKLCHVDQPCSVPDCPGTSGGACWVDGRCLLHLDEKEARST